MRSRDQLREHAAGTLGRLLVREQRQLVESPPLAVAAGTPLLWAKITSIVGDEVKAKFADTQGNVDPEAEEFRVYVYATAAEGVTWSPSLEEASPKLVVSQHIQVVQMPASGAERPAGWWMVGPPLALTCLPTGEEDGLDWLLANVEALRALVEG